MGDRRNIERATPEYFSLLEDFMETLTEEVERKGHPAPTFHVFTEALHPCPSPESGSFNEFPHWPVERDQVSRVARTRVHLLGFCSNTELKRFFFRASRFTLFSSTMFSGIAHLTEKAECSACDPVDVQAWSAD